MADAQILDEIVEDARAYLAAGDLDNAVAVLFEGYASSGSPAVRDGLENAVGSLVRSLWDAKNLEGGLAAARACVREIAALSGAAVDSHYAEIYARALAETGTSPFPLRRLYRHRNLLRVFERVSSDVAGDVVECGCARGLSSLELCLAMRRTLPHWRGEGFHIYDSFEGLSAPTEKDAVDSASKDAHLVAANMLAGQFAASEALVARNMHRLFPEARLHAGWIPDIFSREPERAYRFVHVDVDLYQPTIDSLRYFHPRLARGGIVITDDYDWPGAKRAFDEFAAQHALELQTTDTNQAYFVKGVAA